MVESGNTGKYGIKFYPVLGESWTRWFSVKEDRDSAFKRLKNSPEFKKIKKIVNPNNR